MSKLQAFLDHRPVLLAVAYQMLGELSRAEDIVQEAWLRWQRSDADVEKPRAYLATIVTRLCMNELESARARKEEIRGDRLPEPVDLEDAGLVRVENLDRISMAFLVLLQRLTPAERAVLLLHEIFEFDHAEIATLIGKSVPACRQLLRRARVHVSSERKVLSVSQSDHRRILQAFVRAASAGDVGELTRLLSEDVVLTADAGPHGGHYGRVRNLSCPLEGIAKVAPFLAAVTAQGAAGLRVHECSLNAQPAVLLLRDGAPTTAILLSVTNGRIDRIFIHADARRLGRVGVHPSH